MSQSTEPTSYAANYRDINFRDHPELYRIGRGEQGVLIAQPYKDELLPHWRFATPDMAKASARTLYAKFIDYGTHQDFVGMDMARKYLQMGWTRSRRYANHPSGQKYAPDGTALAPISNQALSPKAQSAQIYLSYLRQAKADETYQRLKARHQRRKA